MTSSSTALPPPAGLRGAPNTNNMYVYIYIYIYICMYVCIYIYIYIYIYTHLFIYLLIEAPRARPAAEPRSYEPPSGGSLLYIYIYISIFSRVATCGAETFGIFYDEKGVLTCTRVHVLKISAPQFAFLIYIYIYM